MARKAAATVEKSVGWRRTVTVQTGRDGALSAARGDHRNGVGGVAMQNACAAVSCESDGSEKKTAVIMHVTRTRNSVRSETVAEAEAAAAAAPAPATCEVVLAPETTPAGSPAGFVKVVDEWREECADENSDFLVDMYGAGCVPDGGLHELYGGQTGRHSNFAAREVDHAWDMFDAGYLGEYMVAHPTDS